MNKKLLVLIGIIGVFALFGVLTELGVTGGFITAIMDPLSGRKTLTVVGFEEFDVYDAFYEDGKLTVMIRNNNRFENTLHVSVVAYNTDKNVTRIDRHDVDLRLQHVYPSVLKWETIMDDVDKEIAIDIVYYYPVDILEENPTFLIDKGKLTFLAPLTYS
jgi:hypothetical protein